MFYLFTEISVSPLKSTHAFYYSLFMSISQCNVFRAILDHVYTVSYFAVGFYNHISTLCQFSSRIFIYLKSPIANHCSFYYLYFAVFSGCYSDICCNWAGRYSLLLDQEFLSSYYSLFTILKLLAIIVVYIL